MTALAAYSLQETSAAKPSRSNRVIAEERLSKLEQLVSMASLLCGTESESIFSADEKELMINTFRPQQAVIEQWKRSIIAGSDILGEEYCRIKSPELRRSHGAIFTPDAVVASMFDWAGKHIDPKLIVDPGAGSARYAVAAALRFPGAKVIAVEIDPVLRILAKTRIQLLGLADRVTVHAGSFLDFDLPKIDGPVLYVGNPPYVRHHDIAMHDKKTFSERCKRLGLHCSSLAGLHIHFIVKVFELARDGDAMSFITSAEWLDTNYAKGVRDFLSSGQNDVTIGEFCRKDTVFEGAMTSAVITSSIFGKASETICFNKLLINSLSENACGMSLQTASAMAETSWSELHTTGPNENAGGKTLGDYFKISRGMVTGMNKVWIATGDTPPLPDYCYCPCIASAGDITGAAGNAISSTDGLESIVVLPESLEDLPKQDLKRIDAFLKWAKSKGADKTFTAKQRKQWWVLKRKEAAPIVMTYMGRRPPVFVKNTANVTFLNIAHGLYPRRPMSEEELDNWVSWLNRNVSTSNGRGYAGGLVKFEPGEAMRIPVPETINNNAEKM